MYFRMQHRGCESSKGKLRMVETGRMWRKAVSQHVLEEKDATTLDSLPNNTQNF